MQGDGETCALCGMKITGDPVVRTVDGEEKHFCCSGCAHAYERAHESDMLPEVAAPLAQHRPGFTDLVLPKGEKDAYFALDGMWCAGCAVAAERVLSHQPGVKSVDVSFAAERGRIRYDPSQVDLKEALQRLDGLGYRAQLLTDPTSQQMERRQERLLLQLLVAAAFGMQIMLLYIAWLYPNYHAGAYDTLETRRLQYVVWGLATPVLFVGGSSILRGAWRALRARTATMDTLVALGTLSAYVYSAYISLTGSGEVYFDSMAMIVTFIMLGRYLEAIGGSQARKDIRHLLSLQPEKALRKVDKAWQEVPAAKLVPEDLILIKPGQRVPADAVIQEGSAAVDESMLTGESVPAERAAGDPIYAGSLVTDSALIARVLQTVGDTRLAHIAQIVEQTLANKPPIQRIADRASAYFAFGILAVSALTVVGWLVTQHSLSEAILAGVAVLVVACPCALGLATPLAITVTLGQASRAGVLVRNPAAIETAARTSRVVFDKTGTLTQGKMSLVAVKTNEEHTEQELLCEAAAVEQFSEHPIAKAIVAACSAPLPHASHFETVRGQGVSAHVDGRTDRLIAVGSFDFLHAPDQGPLAAEAQARSERGETVIWIGWNQSVRGFIALRDEPNPTAAETAQRLRAAGIKTVMLSGDNPQTTRAIAAEVGLDDYEGGCSPEAKAARIAAWQGESDRVAMAGDGVNDAPALAQADLSITVASGTDVAGETSDLVLMQPDLALIPWFINLSQRTRRIIYENLGWAFAYNLLAVPLAAFGVISPIIAAAAMATSSLLVVGNSLRLRR